MGGGLALLILFTVCWLAYLYFYPSAFGTKSLGYLLLVFFIIRGTFAILNSRYEFFPLQMDAALYHEMALDVADAIDRLGWACLFSVQSYQGVVEPGYVVPLGIVYHIIGRDVSVGFVLNTFVFMLTGYNVYRIGRMLFGERGATLASAFYSVFPYCALESTYLHRDPLVNYILSEFFLRLFYILRGGWNLMSLIGLSATIVYSGILRRENLVLIFFVLGVLCVFYVLRKRTILTPVKVGFAASAILLCYLLVMWSGNLWLFRGFSQVTQLEMLQNRIEMLEPESAYLEDQEYTSYSDLVVASPVRAFYFLFSPLPWKIFKESQYIALGETMFMVIAMLYLPKALLLLYRKNTGVALTVALYLVLGIMGAGLVHSNSAGAQRHRTQFSFLMVSIGIPTIGFQKKFLNTKS